MTKLLQAFFITGLFVCSALTTNSSVVLAQPETPAAKKTEAAKTGSADSKKTDSKKTEAKKTEAVKKTENAKTASEKTAKTSAVKTESQDTVAAKTTSADTSAKTEKEEEKENYDKLTIQERFNKIAGNDRKISKNEYDIAQSFEGLAPSDSFESLNTNKSSKDVIDIDKEFLDLKEFEAAYQNTLLTVFISIIVLVVPFVVGIVISKQIRMPEYSTKIGAILCVITVCAVSYLTGEVKLGIDLSGGVNLVYEIDQEKFKEQQEETGKEEDQGSSEAQLSQLKMEELIASLYKRLDPAGTKQLDIHSYGPEHVEIIIPHVGASEIEVLKRTITQTGFLEFRITANTRYHQDIIEIARSSESRIVEDAGTVVARWVTLRDASEGGGLETRTRPNGTIEALVVIEDTVVRGDDLKSSRMTYQNGRPVVSFKFKPLGSVKMGRMTGDHLPDDKDTPQEFSYKLGIILDGVLQSAPNIKSQISDSGIIEGDFTEDDVQSLVGILNAGSLPAALKANPVSTNEISALLGQDTIKKGITAITISSIGVIVFMLFYYRFAGVVACFALLTNLIIIMGVMVGIKGALTLPGLAGLVLTVGMAVDANVLIFERIREELNRGAALRMAIRNGFEKATITIVDANLTTLITAVVLYWVGTSQIRGFAVTLFIGIISSMFTAIFCSRIIFDICEKKRWLKQLNMMKLLGSTNINFLGKRRLAAICSIAVITIGFFAVFKRGANLLDIDFTGGTSVQLLFKKDQGMSTADFRAVINKQAYADGEPWFPDVTISKVGASDDNTRYKLNTSLGSDNSIKNRFEILDSDNNEQISLQEYLVGHNTDDAKQRATARFTELYKNHAAETSDLNVSVDKMFLDKDSFTIEPRDIQLLLEETFPGKLRNNVLTVESIETAGIRQPTADNLVKHQPLPADNILALADETQLTQATEPAKKTASAKKTEAAKKTEPAKKTEAVKKTEPAKKTEKTKTVVQPPKKEEPTQPTDDAERPAEETVTAALNFAEAISKESLKIEIEEAATSLDELADLIALNVTLVKPETSTPENKPNLWTVTLTCDQAKANAIFASLQTNLAEKPVFPSSSHIGGQVAGNTQTQALLALSGSLIVIIGYIWIRFQKVSYGLAAVVALVHDVSITIGAMALSYYVAQNLGMIAEPLMIDPFKISLPVLAAFLTIIGYSLNDTIVVFDRIREVKGKSPHLTADMINTSINQTLSRTLLTSLTTLIVVIILYFGGGQGIHGFAFALVIGVFVGTYSSVFIASPVLLWMSSPSKSDIASGSSQKEEIVNA